MKKILIVEDDKDISKALTLRLKGAGFEVAVAYDAVLAMTEAKRFEPDLALLDISIPGGDAFKVMERFQEDPVTAGMPVVILTASKRPELRDKAKGLGAAAFFEKPYDSKELLDAIHSSVDRPRATT